MREHVDRVTTECAAMIAAVIHDDTGLPDEASRLLAVSLVGMAQVSARFWLAEDHEMQPRGRRRPGRRARLAGHPRLPAHRLTTAHDHAPRPRSTDRRDFHGGQDRRPARPPRAGRRDRRDDADAVEKQVTEAVAGDGVLALTDTKGRRVIVPADRISYVEIGDGTTGHVGFRS